MANQDSTSETSTAYEARAAWGKEALGDHLGVGITRAVVRDGSIAIDWPPTEGATSHTLLTRRAGAGYSGETVWAGRTLKEQRAVVEATLSSNEAGHVLVGEGRWSSGEVDWFVVQLANGRAI